jgi:UDP-N-acetylmuramate--alanine ligase
METYGQDFDQLKTAFVQFLQRMPFYGAAILCTDDPGVQSIVPQLTRPVTTYGLNEGAALRAVNVRAVGRQMHFTVLREKPLGCADLPVVLNLTGLHNVRNALAAMAVAAELRIADDAVLQALAQFQGVGRRFECYGELPLPTGGTVALIDDYGHHPVEIEATLAAARGAYPGRRLVLAFQPHRYTRTRDLLADFVCVLGAADVVLLTEVYGAGESPIAGADGAALFQALRSAGKQESLLVEDIAAMPAALVETARAGDVLLCMGAGSIGEVPAAIARLLSITELSTQEVCRL